MPKKPDSPHLRRLMLAHLLSPEKTPPPFESPEYLGLLRAAFLLADAWGGDAAAEALVQIAPIVAAKPKRGRGAPKGARSGLEHLKIRAVLEDEYISAARERRRPNLRAAARRLKGLGLVGTEESLYRRLHRVLRNPAE